MTTIDTYWQNRARALTELADLAGAISGSKGFHDRYRELTSNDDDHEGAREHLVVKLALIDTEVAEAIEAVRNDDIDDRVREDGKPEGLASELADIIIRTLDLADMLWIDIGEAVLTKLTYNQQREHMHGKTL